MTTPIPPRPDRPTAATASSRRRVVQTIAASIVLVIAAVAVGVGVATNGPGTMGEGAAVSPSNTRASNPGSASPSRSPGPFDDPALDLIETRLYGPGDADWSRFVADDGSFALKAPGPVVTDDLDDGGTSFAFGPYVVTPVLYIWPVDVPIARPGDFTRWTIRRWVDGRSIVDPPHPVAGTRRDVWQASVERDRSTEIYRATYGRARLYVLAVSYPTRNDRAGDLARRLVATFVLDPHAVVG